MFFSGMLHTMLQLVQYSGWLGYCGDKEVDQNQWYSLSGFYLISGKDKGFLEIVCRQRFNKKLHPLELVYF